MSDSYRANSARADVVKAAVTLRALARKVMLAGLAGLVIGGAPSALAQSWQEFRAHDKGCSREKTRLWHVRCETANGGWSHQCRDSRFTQFKGLAVERQNRLADRAWSEVATRDPSCGWPQSSARWADERAHDKGCVGDTRMWHVRCEDNAGSQTSCPDRREDVFRGTTVYSQGRQGDRAWMSVATRETGCGWGGTFANEKALMARALTTLDVALAVRNGAYDDDVGQTDGWAKGRTEFTNPTVTLNTDARSNAITAASSDIRMQAISPGTELDGMSRLTVFRRHSRHLMNFVILSDARNVYVSFWGTVFGENQPANFIATAVINSAYKNAWTHPGYAGVAYDIWNDVKAELVAHGGNTKRVVMTGHSMGGGVVGHLMFLALQDNALDKTKAHRLMTFGTPRYGSNSLRREFEAMVRGGYTNTMAYDVELAEDNWPTAGSVSIQDGRMGTRIRLPLAGVLATWSDPHSHTNYYSAIDAL